MARFGSITSIFGLNFAGRFSATGTITPSTSAILEGNSISFTVASNIISQQITYRVVHGSTTNADFNPSSSTTGTVTTNSSGGATITLVTVNDMLPAGMKTFAVEFSYNSVVVATSSTVNILETASVVFSSYPTSVNEGSSATYSVSTANISNGTTLYWTILHSTTDSADFTATSSPFTISSNAGSFSVTTVADATTEGAQSFKVEIRIGSTSGTVVATTSNFTTIADTSTTPAPTFSFSSQPSSINEGGSGTFNVTTTNYSGSTLTWSYALATGLTQPSPASPGTVWTAATDANMSLPLSGTINLSGGAGSFTTSIQADGSTEGTEYMRVYLYTGSPISSSNYVAASNWIPINDTSVSITATASVTSVTLVNNTAFNSFIPVTASGGTTPYTYSISPALPAGLSFNTSTGIIEGFNPLPASSYTLAATTYTVTVRDSSVPTTGSASGSFTLRVVTPVSLVLQDSLQATWTVNSSTTTGGLSSYRPYVGSGGSGSYTYSMSSGRPSGLSFNTATGAISGTPTVSMYGTAYTFTVTDSVTGTTASNTFYMKVNELPGKLLVQWATGAFRWTVPPGVTSISVMLMGGGGGGAYSSNLDSFGGGGGGGGAVCWINNIPVTDGGWAGSGSADAFVAKAGMFGLRGDSFSSGSSQLYNGGSGGSSTFTTGTIDGQTGRYSGTAFTVTANGGAGGIYRSNATTPAAGGAGGTFTSSGRTATGYNGGQGGNARTVAATTKAIPGGGGAGGGSSTSLTQTGGTGGGYSTTSSSTVVAATLNGGAAQTSTSTTFSGTGNQGGGVSAEGTTIVSGYVGAGGGGGALGQGTTRPGQTGLPGFITIMWPGTRTWPGGA